MLSKQDIDVLNQVIETEGKCLNSKRCQLCPFRAMCLPEFLLIPLTPNQRFNKALEILTHHSLLDENLEVEEYLEDHKKNSEKV